MANIQQEIGKREPFASLEEEALLNLLKTTDTVELSLSRLFREFGLTMSQYNVLRILNGEGRPMPCHEIIDRMIQTVPAMTGLVDRLERQELLKRHRSTEDRRQVQIAITPKGSDLVNQIAAPLKKLHSELLGHLTKTKLKQLSAVLTEIRR